MVKFVLMKSWKQPRKRKEDGRVDMNSSISRRKLMERAFYLVGGAASLVACGQNRPKETTHASEAVEIPSLAEKKCAYRLFF